MRETWNFGGKKHSITAPTIDGLALVRDRYPTACWEGMPGHYSYAIDNDGIKEVVAESWIKNHTNGWWLKIKPLPKNE